jgi:peptidoglycan/LPS O-acetylase OafA/YrhL
MAVNRFVVCHRIRLTCFNYKEMSLMLHLQPEQKQPISKSLRIGGAAFGRRWSRLLPFALLLVLLSACASGEAPPAAICDTYDRALFTTQLMGGAAVILGLAVLGFKKNLSAIFPSQGAQFGAIAGSVGLGLILLAFSTDIGNQILTGFGIESLYTLCGLG